jgi:hypothetical protein
LKKHIDEYCQTIQWAMFTTLFSMFICAQEFAIIAQRIERQNRQNKFKKCTEINILMNIVTIN